MARQTRKQLQFSGFEIAMIAVSFVVTLTAVFFLGLFVGKRNAYYHASADDRVARIPVDDFTRYKRPAPIEKPRPAPPAVLATPAAAETAGKPPSETVSPAEPSAPASVAPAAATAAAQPLAAADAAKAAKAAEAKASADAAAQKAAKEAKAKEAAALAAKEKEKAAREAEQETGRGYTVQVLSTRKQAEADALVAKLKSRGYAAYIKKVSEGESGAWYRVRVGSYGAFGEARGMADKCRRDLGLGQAFVSTE